LLKTIMFILSFIMYSFFIKDYSGNVLHKGFMFDGLYSFSSPLQHCLPSAFVGARISIIN
jgi:hypothetical protein